MTQLETIGLIFTFIGTLVSVVAALYAIERKYGFVAKLANRAFFDLIDDVATDEWNESLKIEQKGNTYVTIEMKGHVNFDVLHEKEIEIISSRPVRWDDIKFRAQNRVTIENIKPHVLLDADRYKRVGLDLGTLGRGDKFHLKCEYVLPNNYSWAGLARHSHRAFHNERRITMSIEFPPGVTVSRSSVRAEEKTCGGITKHLVGKSRPRLVGEDHHIIVIDVQKARKGSTYSMIWNAARK